MFLGGGDARAGPDELALHERDADAVLSDAWRRARTTRCDLIRGRRFHDFAQRSA